MKPQTIGRALGIGLRVAGRIASQRMAAGAPAANQSAATSPAPQAVAGAPARGRAGSQAAGQAAGRATGGIARGVAGFLRPFRRLGGILWLEVTGVFFFLPVVAFAPAFWRTKPSSLYGPYDKTFLVTAAVMAVFLYLSVSSFWRARKR